MAMSCGLAAFSISEKSYLLPLSWWVLRVLIRNEKCSNYCPLIISKCSRHLSLTFWRSVTSFPCLSLIVAALRDTLSVFTLKRTRLIRALRRADITDNWVAACTGLFDDPIGQGRTVSLPGAALALVISMEELEELVAMVCIKVVNAIDLLIGFSIHIGIEKRVRRQFLIFLERKEGRG